MPMARERMGRFTGGVDRVDMDDRLGERRYVMHERLRHRGRYGMPILHRERCRHGDVDFRMQSMPDLACPHLGDLLHAWRVLSRVRDSVFSFSSWQHFCAWGSPYALSSAPSLRGSRGDPELVEGSTPPGHDALDRDGCPPRLARGFGITLLRLPDIE